MKLIRYQTNYPTNWSSFERISPLRDLLEHAVNARGPREVAREQSWTPALDVYEDEDSFTVELEAAGLRKDDFEISLHQNTLTVNGKRHAETESREGASFRNERLFGSFTRSLQLPAAVKPGDVSATYTDGLLRVRLAKAEESKPRKIDVEVG